MGQYIWWIGLAKKNFSSFFLLNRNDNLIKNSSKDEHHVQFLIFFSFINLFDRRLRVWNRRNRVCKKRYNSCSRPKTSSSLSWKLTERSADFVPHLLRMWSPWLPMSVRILISNRFEVFQYCENSNPSNMIRYLKPWKLSINLKPFESWYIFCVFKGFKGFKIYHDFLESLQLSDHVRSNSTFSPRVYNSKRFEKSVSKRITTRDVGSGSPYLNEQEQ